MYECVCVSTPRSSKNSWISFCVMESYIRVESLLKE